MLYDLFRRMKEGTEYLNYGRPLIRNWGAQRVTAVRARGGATLDAPVRVLDLGCGHGTDLRAIREEALRRIPDVGLELYGVENYEPYIRECEANGIRIFPVDIERDRYPTEDGFFDLVLANQVLEHTKEVFWIFSEVARVLRPGGSFIAGVPNLASLHNRLLLLFGQQPSAQKTMSAHVRSFTYRDLASFGETGDYLSFARRAGSNFYPFPPAISRPLAWLFPSLAWGLFLEFDRTQRTVGSFLDCLAGEGNLLETPFYGSPQNPARVKRRTPATKAPRRAARKKKATKSAGRAKAGVSRKSSGRRKA